MGGGDLGGRRGDKEISALGRRFAVDDDSNGAVNDDSDGAVNDAADGAVNEEGGGGG